MRKEDAGKRCVRPAADQASRRRWPRHQALSGATGGPEGRGWILPVVSWPTVRIAVIACFLPRPADARGTPDVRPAQPVSVSYREEPGLAARGAQADGASSARISRQAPAGALSGGWFPAARWTISRGKAGAS